MATRSTIAVQLEDGSVIQCYCHWDGYISYNGRILQEAYNDRDSAEALVQLGSISSLQRRIFPEGEHSFNKPEEGTTVFYHRDRGEELSVNHFETLSEYFLDCDFEDYNYLFRNGEWEVVSYATNDQWVSVSEALEREDAAAAE
jgi:hypothetical protein